MTVSSKVKVNSVLNYIIFSVLSLVVILSFSLLFGVISLILIPILLILIEVLLKDNLPLFLEEKNLNVKKIPKLILDRKYDFLFPEEDKINWDHDNELGWELHPNSRLGINISFPELSLNHKFSYHTESDGCRVTSNELDNPNNKPIISILGCSFTYGHSLDDKDTYSWMVQENFSDKKVKNYAVAGYSLYQGLLTLEKNIDKEKPEVVVVGFHPDLGWRNTCSFEWAHRIKQTWKIPSCLSIKGKLTRFVPTRYQELPFSRFGLIKMLEIYWNRITFRGRGDDSTIKETMKHLLLQMRKVTEKNSSKFLIACIDNSKDYHDFFIENDFNWCMTDVDTSEVDEKGKYKWILYPFDNHPNRKANEKYATSITEAIEKLLSGYNYTPSPERLNRTYEKKERGAYIYPHF